MSALTIFLLDLLLTVGGADLKASDARGYTALHHAAQCAAPLSSLA